MDLYEQNKRFTESCAIMRKKAAEFQDLLSESSSEEEDEVKDAELLEKTFSHYSDEDQSLSKVREYLQDILTSGAIVCLICIDSIKRNEKVWSCRNCYGLLHLHCIQKWAKDSMYHQSTSLDEDKRNSLKWCCPKCRCNYLPSEKPSSYFCFCGKVENPSFDSWSVPHSCGKSCNKNLKPECGHTCLLLCHPGPCPPCSQTALVTCCCSKSQASARRCGNKEWLCGKVCGKELQCKIHQCGDVCHKGPCLPCKQQSKQKCRCGDKSTIRPCYDLQWQCEKMCKRPLQCSHHTCEVICHEGNCPGCPDSGNRVCPCGKKSEVLPCTEKVLPCGDTCNKLLECELHRCSQRCHYGPCGKCLQMRLMKCRCGQREKSVPCCKEFVCDVKCKLRRDCVRHNCNRKCCTGNCPPCEVVCGRTLNCGNHKCTSMCHPGPCYPCRERIEVTCNCGSTKISVPCGRKKSAVPPRCSFDCKQPPDCHHPQRHKHKCHFETCPPCRLACRKKLDCGHTCPAKCHSAVLTKIERKKKKEGPWDLINAYEMELVCKICPPCQMPVPVTCVGGHETHDIPCHMAVSTSCGRPCGRSLPCGNHSCSLECHCVKNPADLIQHTSRCETCSQPCSKPRKEGCNHPCLQPCHPTPCKACLQRLKVKCHCAINALYVVCEEWGGADEGKRNILLSCSNRCPKEMICGHRCTLLCHSGICTTQESCKKKITLRCPCKRRKKEVQCFTQMTNQNIPLSCDQDCAQLLESAKAKEQQKAVEKEAQEKMALDKELQEFLKKTEGKKRKKIKKHVENTVGYDWSRIFKIVASATAVCVFGMLMAFAMSGPG